MRKNFFVIIFALILAVLLVSGCASQKGAGIPGISIGENLNLKPLERAEYEVLGPATGKASVAVNTLFPLPIAWFSGDYSCDVFGINENRPYGQISFPVTSVFNATPGSTSASASYTKRPDLNIGFVFWTLDPGYKAKEAAVFRAIESVPGADAIISPRFYVEINRMFFWHKRVCVTVKGKAIKIKTDDELNK